jgi:hypothetical protein
LALAAGALAVERPSLGLDVGQMAALSGGRPHRSGNALAQ